MDRKKIVIIYAGSKTWGGVETYLVNFFKYYDRSKIEPVLIGLGSWPLITEIEKQGGKVKIFSRKRINILTIFKVASFLKKEKADLIVSGGVVPDSYARAISLFSNIPHLSIVHSDIKYDYPNPFSRFIYSFLIFGTRWKTKHYVAVSEFLKKSLIKKGIRTKNIDVVYNGVESLNVKDSEKKNGENIIIGSVGRLHPVKGYENLITAFYLLDNKYQLEIIGEGFEEKNLRCLIKKLNLIDRVKIINRTSVLATFYRNIDVYIQPSLSEGFGLTVAEAMSAGLPVIVTPRGSLPEIVENNVTGIITSDINPQSLARAIDSLARDKEKMKKIAKSGKESVENRFDVKTWANNLTNVFLETAK